MNYIFRTIIIVATILLVACNGEGNKASRNNDHISSSNCDIKEQFDEYRRNIQQKNISEVNKTLIDFSKTSNIWQVVSFNMEEETLEESLLENKFTETDLAKNFNQIFTEEFAICLGKVNTDKLFESGEFITEDFEINKEEVCRIISTFDSLKKEVTLVLSYDFYEDGDKYESSINFIYSFKDCDVKMKDLLLIN